MRTRRRASRARPRPRPAVLSTECSVARVCVIRVASLVLVLVLPLLAPLTTLHRWSTVLRMYSVCTVHDPTLWIY